MKSFIATVSPAPARPRTVVVCVGMPKMMNRMTSAPTACAANFTTARKRVDALVLRRHAGEQAFDDPVGEIHGEQNQQNPEADSIMLCKAARWRFSTSAIQLA